MDNSDVAIPPERVQALQAGIEGLPGVRSCRIVVGADGRVEEVHVLAEQRPARQVAQDVVAVFQVQTGQPIEMEKVSVAVLEPSPAHSLRASRLELQSLSLTRREDGVRVRVELALGTNLFPGEAASTQTDRGLLEAVAQATLQAAEEAMPKGVARHFRLEEVRQEEVDHQPAVLVAFTSVGEGEKALLGGAPQRRDAAEAVVRACLDALNAELRAQYRLLHLAEAAAAGEK